MIQPLFIEPCDYLEKTGKETTLPEDPNMWPNEILQALYTEVPYIADFDPHIEMDKVDAEKGFGFGHVEVMNKTESQSSAGPQELEAAGVKQARIPIIIKNRKLQPFDVIVTDDSKMIPLTESRLRRVVFRPSAFDITSKTPGDHSMIGQLYPPNRTNNNMGGTGQTMDAGAGKMASAGPSAVRSTKVIPRIGQLLSGSRRDGLSDKLFHAARKGNTKRMDGIQKLTDKEYYKVQGARAAVAAGVGASLAPIATKKKEKTASILEGILPTINERDYNAFFEKMTPSLQAAFVKNASSTASSLSLLAKYVPMSTAKTAAALEGAVTPTVVQISKADEGYTVKKASHRYWSPVSETWDRGQLVQTFGEKIALDADMSGSVTMATGAMAENDGPEADRYELIKDFGLYKVRDESGKELVGYVFPNLLDLDGTPLPLCLFTNGSQAAVQGEIVGIRAGEGASLMEGHPRGKGAFYEVLGNGKAQATIPMSIQGSMAQGGEGSMSAQTFDGRPVTLSVQPNINKLTEVDGQVLVPETMRWMPLDAADEVVLSSDADGDGDKVASRLIDSVTVRCGGQDSYTVSGYSVEKVASEDKSFLSFDEAVFLLSGLGADPSYAGTKLAQAYTAGAPVDVCVGRQITLPGEAREAAMKTASEHLADFPSLKRDLVKEAAVIGDPVAVDTVLSLGFINPENLSHFVSYLPTLDLAQEKMCELLIASRLGLKDIPTSALERAVRSTEEVVEGLKVLAFSNS